MSREEQVEKFIYDVLTDRGVGGVGYTAAGFAVAYAMIQIAAAMNRAVDVLEKAAQDE